MQFKVKETGKIVEVELRTWHNGFDAGWGIDESRDLMSSSVDGLELDDDRNYLITQDQLDETLDWWSDEARKANADPYEYCGDGLNGTRYGRNPEDFVDEPDPDEWKLFVEEMYYDEQGRLHSESYKDFPYLLH